ncbi:MAG: sugar phosphate isomerase/epimerase [Alphaproteobacteria bacterium]|nr:sugar phosphate isomerase/epimerase [Alphaproteobacteria bacterium]
MSGKTLKQRIGIDIGRRVSVEEGLEWAAKNDVHFIDVQTDIHPNALESFDAERIAGVRALKEKHNINLGLHTLSGVNVAEFSPFCRDAVDAYLKAYIDLAPQVGADWIVVHGGYHFTACRTLRMQTAIDRLKRMAGYAEEKGVLLLLENLNWEPVLAEVNYMPVTPAETMHFLTEINSPAVRWSFTANHAHFLPGVGISNFIDAVDFSLCHEVRLADNNGSYEIHQRPGEGTIDFGAMFKKIEGLGYKGHYTNGFTTIDDMLAGRDYMVARAAEAGVKID